jgi:hypothetical protein
MFATGLPEASTTVIVTGWLCDWLDVGVLEEGVAVVGVGVEGV